MPIYEYLCERCGHLTEVMQKVGDRRPATCPECGSKRLAKLVSRTAFQLKGGGWYADLYGSPGKKAPEKEKPAEQKEPAEKKDPAANASGKTAPSRPGPGQKAEKAQGKKPAVKDG
ncbi:MAG TPA: zinc ribbon domain-containing protein [Anaeromyxobacteraceae bacterium]|nr:zinc ribbon domain-containing protein [Anaeromyxobacteraceae bacterium]